MNWNSRLWAVDINIAWCACLLCKQFPGWLVFDCLQTVGNRPNNNFPSVDCSSGTERTDGASWLASANHSALESKCECAHRPESQLWCQHCLSSSRSSRSFTRSYLFLQSIPPKDRKGQKYDHGCMMKSSSLSMLRPAVTQS